MTMRKTLLALAALGMGFAAAGPASAVTDGTFVGTVSGNSPFPGNLVFSGNGYDIDSVALYKCDVDQTGAGGCSDEETTDSRYDGDFSFTFDGGFLSGTWSYSPDGDEPLLPHYMVLKGGPEYTIWDISGLTGGNWMMPGQQALSNISFYNSDPGVIPLPAAGWLLISGVAGLAAAGARKRRA
jgi:hypothetical protein